MLLLDPSPFDDISQISGRIQSHPRVRPSPWLANAQNLPTPRHQIQHQCSRPELLRAALLRPVPLSLARKWSQLLAVSLIGSSLWGVVAQRAAIAHPIATSESVATSEPIASTVSASASSQRPGNWGDPYTGNGTSTDSRSSCTGLDAPLVALVPDVNLGRSLSDTPTLWFYVPARSDRLTMGSFVLLEEDYSDVLSPLDFTLDNTAGFVGVRLPKSSVALMERNKPYHWYFELHCDDSSSVVSVDGWIERTTLDDSGLGDASTDPAPDPAQWTDQALDSTSLQAYAFYRNHFIWFDAFDVLLQELSNTNSDDAKVEFLSLLQSANVSLDECPIDADVTLITYD